MARLLLITPPFVQPNTAYPATAYLTGYLRRKGYEVAQEDLSIDTLCSVFSKNFLKNCFDNYCGGGDDNTERIHALRNEYLATIDTVMAFLQGGDPALANLICSADFLPEASRFEQAADLDEKFGEAGVRDCAEYLATLYLQDLSDFIRATVSEHFEIVKYAERLSAAIAEFSTLENELQKPMNAIEQQMCSILRNYIERHKPETVGITVPFPGNLLSALRCGQYIKANFPSIKIVLGGGYPSTELRAMTDREIFSYVDYVCLDDGEKALKALLSGKRPPHTYTADGFDPSDESVSHSSRGCPDYEGLPFGKYFSLTEVVNPMHRLWSDGRWNKMMLAHGCYWARCAFCDTTLPYINQYDALKASEAVDYMERIAATTGSRGFHFVDEAAPPKLLKEIALELLRRGDRFAWWANIRFETAFTQDLCVLLARSGCIAVSGGLEVASDRLLKMINKGVTVEQAAMAMRNFYYAGIMVHSYLMYGLPTETLQETVDALEVVRQMFRAELIGSAFWHRYAMTVHSPSGAAPEEFGVRRKDRLPNPFANNEVAFAENRGYDLRQVGGALAESLANYMAGRGLDKPVHKWFAQKAPATTVEPTLITDCLIKPDRSRIFDPRARAVWLGGRTALTEGGILVRNNSEEREIIFAEQEAEFVHAVAEQTADIGQTYLWGDIEAMWVDHFDKPFIEFYSSKKFDIIRKAGLLQI